MTMKRFQRVVKPGEHLAMAPEAVQSGIHGGRRAMWWDFWTPVPANTREGSVAVVHVRGALEHHRGYGSDSYESIVERVADAFTGEDVRRAAEQRARWAEEGSPEAEVPDASPPSAVVMRIDSPGGVCSGLNQTVFALRKIARSSGIPLIAYVDELAASAAYALSCACDEIIMPPSAIAGSIGVISAMYDVTEADKKAGVKFVTITSGERKADGHPHVPISAEAVSAEQQRVDRLARQFFRIVATARPIDAKKAASYQAGIFLGKEAVSKGLADGIMGWDELVASLNDDGPADSPRGTNGKKQVAKPGQDESGSTAHAGTTGKETRMSLAMLKGLVRKTKAAIESATDPKAKKRLAATLAAYTSAVEAYKKEKHTKEVHESEEGDEEDEEEAEGNETDREESDDDGDDDSDDDGDGDDDDDSNDEEESAESDGDEAEATLASVVRGATGKTGREAIGALKALFEDNKRTSAMVAKMARERRAEKKTGLIATALTARRITKHEAKTLGGKDLKFVRGFLDMRKSAIVNTDDESVAIPDPSAKVGDGTGLSAEIVQSIETAVNAAPSNLDKDKLRASMIAEHQKRISAGMNGAGRY